MSTPSPFEIGRQIGTNFYNSRRESNDNNAIENILSEAMGSGDPAMLQNSIGKILSKVSPERQGAAVKYLQDAYNNVQQRQQQQQQEQKKQQQQQEQFAREEKAGLVPGINATAQAAIYKEKAKAGRLGQYGLDGGSGGSGGSGGQPQEQNQMPAQSGQQQPQQQESVFKRLSDDQLVQAQSHPDMEVRNGAAAEERRRIEGRKLTEKETKRTRDEELQFHKESEKYDEELSKQTRTAKKQVEAVDNIDKALSSGNVSPTSLANIFRGFGKIGDKLSEALINKDEATLLASIPQLLEGWKEVFGVRLSDADLRVLQDKLPSIGKNPDANRSIVKILKKYADMTLLRSQVAKEIKSKNKGVRPLGYADQIEERFDQMVMPVKIVNPNTGKVVSIPAYKVSEAIEAGGRLANE